MSGPWEDFSPAKAEGPWSDFQPTGRAPVASSAPIGDLPPDFGSAQMRPGEIDNAAHTIGTAIAPDATRRLESIPALTGADAQNEIIQALKGPLGSSDLARTAGSKLIPAAPIASGLAGMFTGLGNELLPAYGGTPDKTAAQAATDMAGKLSYEPQTPGGQALGAMIDLPFEALQTAGGAVGGKTLDKTNSPVLATIADTATQALPFLFGGKAGHDALKPSADSLKTEQRAGPTDAPPNGADLVRQVTEGIRAKLQEADQAARTAQPAQPAPPPPVEAQRGTIGPDQSTAVASEPGAGMPATGDNRAPVAVPPAAPVAGAADPAAPLHPWTPTDTQSSVPLAGGVSHEPGGPQVVIDKRMPSSVDVEHPDGGTVPVDAHEAVGLHERTEWPLMHLDGPVDAAGLQALAERAGMKSAEEIPAPVRAKLEKGESLTYAEAHDIATNTENHHVRTKYGVDPDKYQSALTDGIKAAREQAPGEDVPPNIDRKPYEDDGKEHLLTPESKPGESTAFNPDRYQELRSKADRTPEEQAEYTRQVEARSETADVGGQHIPGVLNSVGRAQLEASGKMKRFRVKTDLDDFKTINDTLGHDIGDEALRAKAQAMQEAFGEGNTWREGGDEFGAHADTEAEAKQKMEQVREALKTTKIEGVDVNGKPVAERRLGVSYGIADAEGRTHAEAAKAADNALHADKQARKATGERIGQRATDRAAEPAGLGSAGESQGGGQVPPRAAGQETAVADASEGSRAAVQGDGEPASNVAGSGGNDNARQTEPTLASGDARADSGSTPSSAPRTVAVKNEAVEADRITRGVDAIASEQGPTRAESWQRAKDTAQKDPDAGRRLTQSIIDGDKKALTQDEVALLLHDRVRISNEYHAALDAHDAAKTEPEKVEALLRLREAERQLDANDLADRKSGTENSLGLSARQMLANEDYSLARMGQRLKIAEGVESVEKLPAAVKQRMTELVRQLEEANKKLEENTKTRERGPRKTVDDRAQERIAKQMADYEKTIKERLTACPI